jgi:hypothetical protein
MRRQLALMIAVGTLATACGGTESTDVPVQSGRVTIDGHTRNTKSVSCTQNGWIVTIDADTAPGRAHALLDLGGQQPDVKTVTIENIDDLHGVAGSEVGNARATTDGKGYTIAGTAVGAAAGQPGQSRDMPFEIKAPC